MPVIAAALGFWRQGFPHFLKTDFTNLREFRLAVGGNLDSGHQPRISIPQDIKLRHSHPSFTILTKHSMRYYATSFTSFLHHFDETLNALAMTCVACLQSKLFCLVYCSKKKKDRTFTALCSCCFSLIIFNMCAHHVTFFAMSLVLVLIPCSMWLSLIVFVPPDSTHSNLPVCSYICVPFPCMIELS